MEQSEQQIPLQYGSESSLPELDLHALLANSREAIARAAAEVLAERESETLLATRHKNHSSHNSSSSW